MKKLAIIVISCIACLYLILLIPGSGTEKLPPSKTSPFVWNQDDYWSYLESKFIQARSMEPSIISDSITASLIKSKLLLDSLKAITAEPSSQILTRLETAIFELGPLFGALPNRLPEFIELHKNLRIVIKGQSKQWDMKQVLTRDRLYRLLYGARTAVEEVMLQAEPVSVPALVLAVDEPSQTPSAEILGVTIHSGDILVSRGGAPTSALIARGNDYPGNFSHVALVHVDENTNEVSIIESHIEIGVAIAGIDDYFRDTKLRVLILRLRSDLPPIRANPMLPHEAAAMALTRARQEHIPYDFAMDFNDNSKLFCSEVASDPYARLGIKLWMGISRISSPGVRSWLAAFGVRHFETQEPSDLEYDPQLRVVAEWHDPETLYKDHLDNAVIDVMLESAEAGEMLEYDWYMLPVGRLAKSYSWIKNIFGGIGPIPEGMNAAAALKNDHFSESHRKIKQRLIQMADDFQKERGYRPPYWELVNLARKAKDDINRRK